jgi:hypothetical protein
MKLCDFIEGLKMDEIPLIYLDGKPLRVVEDADDILGYVDVPDLSNSGLLDTPEGGYQVGHINRLSTKRLFGKVEFRKITREKRSNSA